MKILKQLEFNPQEFPGVSIGSTDEVSQYEGASMRDIYENSVNAAFLMQNELMYDDDLPDLSMMDLWEKLELLEETKQESLKLEGELRAEISRLKAEEGKIRLTEAEIRELKDKVREDAKSAVEKPE